MTFGLIARSSLNNTVVFSTEVAHLHFHGYATLTGVTTINSLYGGCTSFTYVSSANGIPLVFLRSTGQLASVVKLSGSPGNWAITVAQKSVSQTGPQVLVFTQPAGIPKGNSNYGLQLFDAAGHATFDSRLTPLSVTHTQSVIPAEIPCNSGRPPDAARFVDQGEGQGSRPHLDWDFDTTATEIHHYNTNIVNPIYASYSTAQSCFERKITQYWYDDEYDGPEKHYFYMLWWCFYREAVRVQNGVVSSGWIPYLSGYTEKLQKEDGWWGGDYVDHIKGSYPFFQATINRTPNYVLVADGGGF